MQKSLGFFREKVLHSQKRFDILYDKLFFGITVYRNAIWDGCVRAVWLGRFDGNDGRNTAPGSGV